MSSFVRPFVVLATMLLGACASVSDSHYYSLMPAAPQVAAASNTSGPANPAYAISVQTVQLPAQVDKQQIVITDAASTQVTPLNGFLWASPLADEIRRALSDDLSRRLGVLDVSQVAVADGLPVWTISLLVQRFQSFYDDRALLDVVWQLVPSNMPGKPAAICRAAFQVPVEQGMSALVAGHQLALHRLSEAIAGQIRSGTVNGRLAGMTLQGCT